MFKIFFPSAYKKSIIGKTKTLTIRTGNEFDKYKIGRTYNAYSYGGTDWKIKLKITEIKKSRISDLEKSEINQKAINHLMKENNLKKSDMVEIIRFKYL